MKHRLVELTMMWCVSAAGCGSPSAGLCAQGGEPTGLAVTLRDADGPDEHPRAGAYTFTVTTELGELEWACTIAADDRIGAGCVVDRDINQGDAAPVLLVSAVADDETFWLSLMVLDGEDWSGPEEAHIVVERDGERVADQQFAPKYVLSPFSGGEGCPRYHVVDGPAPTIEL
jgi:hypothetical protein